jgi:hypothetical protein
MSDEALLRRRVNDKVVNDRNLVEDIAIAAARALNLQGNNRTLGMYL